MTMTVAAALVRAIAPSDLADAIVGDLHERRAALVQTRGEVQASASCRSDILRSLLPLLACGASRALADNWVFALAAAAVTCAGCFATIPLWDHLGLGGTGYHLLRLAVIGLILGCIPRASALSCLFLLALIAAADWTIGAHHVYFLLLQDGAAMTSVLVAVRTVRYIRTAAR